MEKSNGHEILISADSHVMEPHDLWEKGVPEALRAAAPRFTPLPPWRDRIRICRC